LAVIAITTQQKPSAVAAVQPLTPTQFQSQVTKLTGLMKSKGINAAFSYTEQQITSNPSFAQACHPLLHELGHAAYTYYGGYAQAIVYQNELCDSGYTHGVLESYLSSGPDISQALQTACSTTTKVFNQWQCYHGLGHGVMLVSMENVAHSTTLCNTLPTPFSQDACINGVFMQHFVVTDHDGSIPKTNPTSLKDCAVQPVMYKPVCYNYAPSAYLTVNNGQYAAAFKWCHTAETAYIPTCIGGVGSQAMKEHITIAAEVQQICDMADKSYVGDCINGAAGMDVYFYGSAAPAASLCQNQFKQYRKVCSSAVSLEKSMLQL
jgi:hypothetical protein